MAIRSVHNHVIQYKHAKSEHFASIRNNNETKDEMDAFATKQIVIKKTINNCNVWKDQIRDLLCTKWLEENLDYKNDDDDSTNISDNNNGTATELNVMLEHLDL